MPPPDTPDPLTDILAGLLDRPNLPATIKTWATRLADDEADAAHEREVHRVGPPRSRRRPSGSATIVTKCEESPSP